MKFIILTMCAFLALCGADINIQTTTYEVPPDNNLAEISMSPFTKIGDNYYTIETKEKLNWFNAQNFCRRKGGNLATIEAAEEMQALSKYLIAQNYTKNTFFWLSGNDLASENIFSWMGNGQRMSYKKLNVGEPSDKGKNGNCVHLLEVNNEFKMSDIPCYDTSNFICEVNRPKMMTLTVW